MEENIMDDFKVFYDEEEDILYLAKEGEEAEVVEISPGVNMELDSNGNLIGVELFKASRMFKNVLKSMEKKLQVASLSLHPPSLNGMLAAIPAPWSGVKASYVNNKIPYRGESPPPAAGVFQLIFY